MLAQHPIRQLRVSGELKCSMIDELIKSMPELVVSSESGEFFTMYSPFT